MSHSGGMAPVVVHCPFTSYLKLLGQSLPNIVFSIRRVKRQGIVSFTAPALKRRIFSGKQHKIDIFLEYSPLSGIDQTN